MEVGAGNTLCACPTCKQSVDWETRLLATLEANTPSVDRTVWGFQAS